MANATTELKDGTIHVRVIHARELPTMDFGKRQDPFVSVQLEGTTPKVCATTDPAYEGGTSPEWTEQENNELELYFDASEQSQALLTVEVYADELGEDLIGVGQINVTDVVKSQSKAARDVTVKLKDGLGGSMNRGQVALHVWYGPPVRKAFRAAQRASKLLDARDSFVSTIYSLLCGATDPLSKYFQLPVALLKKHRHVSVALAACLGITAAGTASIFLMIALPTTILAALTFPFWIIPFLVTSFFTAPIWIPVLLLVGGFFLFSGTFFLGLGVTSRPVRRKGAMLTTKLKHTDVGKRVVYEKEA